MEILSIDSYRTTAAQNEAGTRFLSELMKKNKGKVIPNTRHGQLIEYRDPQTNFGARWTMDGKVIGIVD